MLTPPLLNLLGTRVACRVRRVVTLSLLLLVQVELNEYCNILFLDVDFRWVFNRISPSSVVTHTVKEVGTTVCTSLICYSVFCRWSKSARQLRCLEELICTWPPRRLLACRFFYQVLVHYRYKENVTVRFPFLRKDRVYRSDTWMLKTSRRKEPFSHCSFSNDFFALNKFNITTNNGWAHRFSTSLVLTAYYSVLLALAPETKRSESLASANKDK